MKFLVCTVLVLVLVTPSNSRTLGGGFNKVLQFPRELSLENYVLLTPDFTEVQEELSICGWVKIYRTDGNRYWFSYNTAGADNQIIFGQSAVTQHFLGDTMPAPADKYTTFIWHHTCFSWSSASQLEELYLNGEKIAEELTPDNSKVPTGGTLVLGQEQDSPGGSFDINQAFGGEIYRLEIFKRKLSASEISDMYQAGMCDYPASSEDVVVDWEDFLHAERSGEVKEVSAGCSRWDILKSFVGQEITSSLIAFLERNF